MAEVFATISLPSLAIWVAFFAIWVASFSIRRRYRCRHRAIKRNISSGRFPHQHYIVLFTKRLEDADVDIEAAKEEKARRARTPTGGNIEAGEDWSWAAEAHIGGTTQPSGTGPYGVGPPSSATEAASLVVRRTTLPVALHENTSPI